MSLPGDTDRNLGEYEVAVAIAPITLAPNSGRESRFPGNPSEDVEPGFDQTAGIRSHGRQAKDFLLEKGDEAVRVATESIARQIGLAAQRIAAAIDTQAIPPTEGNALSLESVEVSFGVTLSAGIEALFTSMTESSAQVTIVLSRRPPDNPATQTPDNPTQTPDNPASQT
jgi:hypothetical protein